MQMVIDIPDRIHFGIEKGFCVNGSDASQIVLDAVKNGTPLPKGHGRLIDADAFERRCMFDINIEDIQDVIYALRDYKPIIEADKAESEEEG